ncbi:MAG: LysR family transcriptional regulator [Tepidanaerobacteraceae bacterium]
MNLISLYYFSELAKDLHMTQTANRLFISQQTLSNHIKRLEEQLGVKLLYRKPALSLTYAGEFVLDFAEVINKEYANLIDILSDIKREERGVIRFGASPMRMNACLPSILSEYSLQYPDVELRLTETISSQLEPLVLDGKLDFALILSADRNNKLVKHHLLNDRVYLCVPDPLLKKYYGDQAEPLKAKAIQGANVIDFAKLPFCMQSNRLGYKIFECFKEGEVEPKTYLTSTNNRITTHLCFQGFAACFATQMHLYNIKEGIPDNINIFPVYHHGEPLTQRLSLIWCKDRYLPRYAKYFLDCLFRFFNNVDQIHMSRKV